jgi:hypothetical protein
MINKFVEVLRQSACQNFEQYQKLCGVIQGLAIAESYLLDLAKKVEETND